MSIGPALPHRPAITGGRPITPAGRAAVGLTLALVGFMLAAQLRSLPGLEAQLATEREADLAQLLADLSARSDGLQEEIVDLRVQLARAAGSSQREGVLVENARLDLAGVRILLGLVPVRGQGIVITIADPGRSVGPDLIVDTIQELRDAGAEAIDVNGNRVVASTAFTGGPGALLVGGAAVGTPYRIIAIGEAQTLAEAMRIPGGVLDTIQARPGSTITVIQKRSVTIASLRAVPGFSYARRG